MRNAESNSPVQARVMQRMSRVQTCERARQTQQADPQDMSGYGARIVSRPKRSQASKHGPSDICPTVIYDCGTCIELWCAICGANATGSFAPHAFFAGFKGVKQHILRAHRPEGAPKPSDKVIWDCVYTRTVSAEDEELMRAGKTPIISIEMATRGEVAVGLVEQYLVAPECTAEDTTLGDTTLAVGMRRICRTRPWPSICSPLTKSPPSVWTRQRLPIFKTPGLLTPLLLVTRRRLALKLHPTMPVATPATALRPTILSKSLMCAG